MKKSEFLKNVMHEINMLKKIATPEELDKLDYYMLNPIKTDECIYGQMTGCCSSERAKELMDASCITAMDLKDKEFGIIGTNTFRNIKPYINDEYNGESWTKPTNVSFDGYYRNFNHLSALECYITLKNAKNKEIIEYLRGEIETLKL